MNSETGVINEALLGSADIAPDVRCERGVAGLALLREDWAVLAAALPNARFYHQYAWYSSYLRNLEPDASSVYFFAFYRGSRPVAIFPLRRAVRSVVGLRLRFWELPFDPHMNLCDVLIAPQEDSAALLRELLRQLGQQPWLAWDVLHLPNLPDDSVALQALQAAALSFVRLTRTGQSMYFPCRSIESALGNASGRFKRNLRRQRKKLDQWGLVELLQVREAATLEAALVDFLQLEASGWKGGGGLGSAIMLHPEVTGFYRDLTTQFGADARCSINLLKLNGKAIAAQYCLIFGARINVLKIAYDEAYCAGAPGSQLLQDILAHCCESASIAELSLVTGPAWAVGRWNPQAHAVWKAQVFNSNPRGLAAYAMTPLMPVAAAAKGLLLRLRERFRRQRVSADGPRQPTP